MRAEIPWNVAGIPPEAREAARAAARREGLSVGEWLTRRILRSFSGMEDETSAAPYENRAPSGAPLDSWGLPPSAASRRDSEEMLARVGRSESESNEAWRRIEEQLRGLGRRLDSSERSHSENNRVLSRTAQEINISAREQAQAFEQLGENVVALNDRLERLERNAVSEGLKEAVKALHQGLSRLADQITATANNSTGQLAQVTTNLEKLAGQVNQVWEDADNADQALEMRIDRIERDLVQGMDDTARGLSQRIENTERTLDTRLAAVEKTVQFHTNSLDHALERIESASNQRTADQNEIQRHAVQHEQAIHRLEDSVIRLESRLPGPELDDRLDGFERAISGLHDQLEHYDPTQKFDAAMQALSHRLEKLEQDQAEAELRSAVARPEPTPPPAPQAAVPSAFEASPNPPPYHEPPSGYEPPPITESPVEGKPPVENFPPHHEHDGAADAFTSPLTPHGFTFDIPKDQHEEPFTPDFADVFEEPPVFEAPPDEPPEEPSGEEDNFLARARRSARAASDKAESERRSGLSAFRWNQDAADSEEKEKPRYLLPVLIALLVVAAAGAALVLSQRAKMPLPAPMPVKTSAAKGPTFSVPAPPSSNDTQYVIAPQANSFSIEHPAAGSAQSSPSDTQGNPQDYPQGNAQDFNSQRSEPAGPDTMPNMPAPRQQHEVSNAPVKPVSPGPGAAAKRAAPVSLDRVNQLANSGNPTALAILGLRALDGGAAANLPDAVKFLTQAAEKGQAVAQYRLGTLYERGQGVAADAARAVHWYGLAANQGNRKAMHNLAVAYAGGVGGKKNMAEAARWFAKAAALGLSDSQFNLAVLYERGDGVPQSLVDAYKWYSIAAASGDTESKARIGILQSQLGDADKAAANKSAATFHAAPLSRSANVPPEPADLG
jgi:localization factor PodJL